MEERRQYSLAQRLVSGALVAGILAAIGWILSPYVAWLSVALYVLGAVLLVAVLIPAGSVRVAGALGYGMGVVARELLSPIRRR